MWTGHGLLELTVYIRQHKRVENDKAQGVRLRACAYEAVCVLWSVAATCTLPMTAVADVGTEAPAVALLSTHRLRHCQETDAGRRQRTCDIHLRSVHVPGEYIYTSQDTGKDRIGICHWGKWRVGRWNLFTFFPRSSTCAEGAGLKLKHLCQPPAIISHGSKAAPDRDAVTAVPVRHRGEHLSTQSHRLPYAFMAYILTRHIYRVNMCTAHNMQHMDGDSV